ncbi:MAG: GNAT family N-acetyltransferase [Candidatus Hodarchaeales archaeon]|jgi:RimJ/RimL family protein N-acetyltransferase
MSFSFPFTGKNVLLRPFNSDDVSNLNKYLNHPNLFGRRYIPKHHGIPNITIDQTEEIIQKWSSNEKSITLAIVIKNSDKLIGHTHFNWGWDPHCPSLDVVIDPENQRFGYGAEVIKIMQEYIFQNTVAHNVTCWIDSWNKEGLSFAEKLGFHNNGGIRRAGIRQGKYYNVVVLDILKTEWIKKEAD